MPQRRVRPAVRVHPPLALVAREQLQLRVVDAADRALADAASVAEAMLPVDGGERGGRVVSISTAPPPNADPPKSGSLNELSVELSSVQSI